MLLLRRKGADKPQSHMMHRPALQTKIGPEEKYTPELASVSGDCNATSIKKRGATLTNTDTGWGGQHPRPRATLTLGT